MRESIREDMIDHPALDGIGHDEVLVENGDLPRGKVIPDHRVAVLSRADLVQAVLEGVAFAIRDSLEVAKALGLEIPRSKLCGGGSKSPLWRTIFANVLGIPLDLVKTEQGPGYGGAMLAMVGCGEFESVQAAADALIELASTTEPEPELTARYEEQYRKFSKIYPALKELFPEIQ